MIEQKQFTFGPFQENTYVIWDETKECIIVDPGCYFENEWPVLNQFITQNQLIPKKLINTHCHLDHIFGNHQVFSTYGLKPWIHEKELPILHSLPLMADMYGLSEAKDSPEPEGFLEPGKEICFGNQKLPMLFTPGHSPGSITFYHIANKWVWVGDCLFQGSIGRTDLPGGNYDTLIASIKDQILPLGDDFTAFSGHGPETSLGFERQYNPFLID